MPAEVIQRGQARIAADTTSQTRYFIGRGEGVSRQQPVLCVTEVVIEPLGEEKCIDAVGNIIADGADIRIPACWACSEPVGFQLGACEPANSRSSRQ